MKREITKGSYTILYSAILFHLELPKHFEFCSTCSVLIVTRYAVASCPDCPEVLGVPHNKRNRKQRISTYQKLYIVEYTVSFKDLALI